MNWFYNKTITFQKVINAYDDETGMYSRSESETITVCCDVQPLDTQTDIDESGKLINANYKVYCDSNSFITNDCTAHYNGNEYAIEKLTDWDDYFIIYIRAVV